MLFLAAVTAVFAGDDAWAKVRDLKRGTEIRIYQNGVKQPLNARMDELTEDRLVIVVKNEQRAIARSEIDRIDARPPVSESRVSRESRTGRETRPAITGSPQTWGRASSSTSSTVKIGSKPEFQTVYRRASKAS